MLSAPIRGAGPFPWPKSRDRLPQVKPRNFAASNHGVGISGPSNGSSTKPTVKPVYQSEVAQRVMTLIDGQQRISTSVMMNIVLHQTDVAPYRA